MPTSPVDLCLAYNKFSPVLGPSLLLQKKPAVLLLLGNGKLVPTNSMTSGTARSITRPTMVLVREKRRPFLEDRSVLLTPDHDVFLFDETSPEGKGKWRACIECVSYILFVLSKGVLKSEICCTSMTFQPTKAGFGAPHLLSLRFTAFMYELQHHFLYLKLSSLSTSATYRVSASMALPLRPVVVVFLFALAQANTELSDCNVLKGKVSCLDCRGRKNTSLSGIQVLVKCDKVKKLWTATTKDRGFFEIEIPSARTTIPSSNCLAKVLGGPHQLYATRNAMVSKIVGARDGSGRPYFTTSTPLAVSTTCPRGKASITCGKNTRFGSSMTVDLPIPREWGLPPTSYYSPVIPIIGIP